MNVIFDLHYNYLTDTYSVRINNHFNPYSFHGRVDGTRYEGGSDYVVQNMARKVPVNCGDVEGYILSTI